MKAIKECKWVVDIIRCDDDTPSCEYYWEAETEDGCGLLESKMQANEYYGEFETARKEWEDFAKINEINNWQYYWDTK